MPNKLLIFEDDGASLAVMEFLEIKYDLDIYQTTNDWETVKLWLDGTPGADSFNALIFDLNVPAYKLGQFSDIPYDKKEHYSPALYFIYHYIKPTYKNLMDKIIIYSAYIDDAKKVSAFDEIKYVIDKLDSNGSAELAKAVSALL